MEFTDEQMDRYLRQIILKEVGALGQEKLLRAKVLIIGAGGLGSPAAMYLAAAGVGNICIADADKVDLTNLQRQIIHSTEDLGMQKVQSAKETINRLNPDVKVDVFPEYVTEKNVRNLVKKYDFIVECTDNFDTKFLINDACVRERKPFSHGGITGFKGQLMTYVPDKGPCYRCVFGEPPQMCESALGCQVGILGAVSGVIGCLQAAETLKYILEIGELLTGKLLTYDALTMNFRTVMLPKETSHCSVCGEKNSA